MADHHHRNTTPQQQHHHDNNDEKEKKWKKQLHRMGKILAKAWELPQSEPFQESSSTTTTTTSSTVVVLDLTTIGRKIDQGVYRIGRHGWEEFAQDLGGVYNRHYRIRKTKYANLAKDHLEQIKLLLGQKDASLVELASEHVPSSHHNIDDDNEMINNNNHSATTTTTMVSSHNNRKKRKASGEGQQHDDHYHDNNDKDDDGDDEQDYDPTNNNNDSKRSRLSSPIPGGGGGGTSNHNKKNGGTASGTDLLLTIGQREDHALETLKSFVEQRGGSRDQVENFRCRVTKKKSAEHRFDINYYNEEGRRFRSMLEVGRYLNLIKSDHHHHHGDSTTAGGGAHHSHGGGSATTTAQRRKGGTTTKSSRREQEAERKRLRKEMDRLKREHFKAKKTLEEFVNDEHDTRFPIEDTILLQDEHNVEDHHHHHTTSMMTRMTCAAARIPDLDGFPGVPSHCVPDVIMAWDFLCTFGRALSVNPIPLDDFAAALTHPLQQQQQPSRSDMEEDPSGGSTAVPVYLAEIHLGLLKLLLHDSSSDDWWWSILETADEPDHNRDGQTGGEAALSQDDDGDGNGPTNNMLLPVIKIDMAALLLEEEDPLVTASWIGALDDVRHVKPTSDDNAASTIKQSILSALPVVANKWVKAYLRKALRKCKTSTKQTSHNNNNNNRRRAAATFAKRAVVWLVDHVRDARPDLWSRNVKPETIHQQRAKIVDDTALLMEKLESSAPAVTEDDLISDADSDDDDDDDDIGDSDDSDEEDDVTMDGMDRNNNNKSTTTATQDLPPLSSPSSSTLSNRNTPQDQHHPASALPLKPAPSIVDILLPPHKPGTTDLINAFTWSQLAGATACRIYHRYKRLRNEVDDRLRDSRGLTHLTVHQRRQRETMAATRIFSECVIQFDNHDTNPLDTAVAHLTSGGSYVALSMVERLCILRVLIEAAYDTGRVYEVVDGNFKQRINAVKALEAEKRRAKREEKDEAAAAETAARLQLVDEAKAKFFEEKRIEIKETNDQTREFDDEFIARMTDDDIVEFDEDIKVEFQSLPGPDSFNKTEVNKMVVKMQEEAAFGTTSLTVLTMEQLQQRERVELENMEGQLHSLGGVDALMDPTLDRESSRTIERLRRDMDRAQKLQETLPPVREAAVEALRDALQDGTLKALKAAVKQANTAKLCGDNNHGGGMWTLDVLRESKVEIKQAEKRKRLLEAQKDLIAKRDKCFIRCEPQGRDRFRNRFWRFENDDRGHLWIEANYLLKEDSSTTSGLPNKRDGYVDLLASEADISVGAEDMEEDLARDEENPDIFRSFCRREYHPAGTINTLAKRHWGCQITEKSLLAVIKKLDERGIRENELKTNLKEALEDIGVSSANFSNGQLDDESENNNGKRDEVVTPSMSPQHILSPTVSGPDTTCTSEFAVSGDEAVFQAALESIKTTSNDNIVLEILDGLSSAIGQRVRVREVLKESKESAVCRYDNGIITGWTFRIEQVAEEHEDDEMPAYKNASVPYWRAVTDRRREPWLSGKEVLEAISRFFSWSKRDKSYFEYDASFLTYRNSLGRHCGRASDAAVSSTPAFLANLMVKREVELYTPLKNRVYDNNWGGKSGARNIWISQMKDYAYDLNSVRQGLLTLENAFFILTGQLATVQVPSDVNGKALLNDITKRFDIELETLDKSPQGIWSSHESRAVFHEIVQSCTTTGVLALALDLLCRNCRAYIDANKMYDVRGSSGSAMSTRTTRRMNAWQQANQQNW